MRGIRQSFLATGIILAVTTFLSSVSLAQSISSITPNNGLEGFSVPVTITGTSTHFTNSSTIGISGSGVTAVGIVAASATQLSATFVVDKDAAAGSRTVTVTSGAEVVTTSFTVNLNGYAALSSFTLDFQHQSISTTSAAKQVTLTNTGHATLHITAISASTGYGVTSNCGATLAIGANCTLNVTFQPQNLGAQAGTVTVADDSAGNPQLVLLTGIGDFNGPVSRPRRPPRP